MESSQFNFPDACLILDESNRIVGINPAGEKLLKVKIVDALGKPVLDVFANQALSMNLDETQWDGWRGVGRGHENEQVGCTEFRVFSLMGSGGNMLGNITILRQKSQSHADSLNYQNAVAVALRDTTFDLHSSLDLEVVLKNIVQRACKLLGTMHGYLYILDDENDDLVSVVGIGALEEVLGYKVAKGEGVAGTVWETEKYIVVNDYDAWTGRSKGFSYGAIRSIVGVPLILNGKIVGVFGVAHGFDKKTTFSDMDVSLLSRFADLAVVALQNAQLYEQAQKEIEFRRNTEIKLRDANQLLQLQIEQIELLQENLKELAVRDSLTELFNRRYLDEMLIVEFARAERSKSSLAILMMDSDHLKEINDQYGHKAGDGFLVHIADVIRRSIRAGDIACRYGGDEFVVVLGNVTENTAYKRAEKLRTRIAEQYFAHNNEQVNISVSIGIAMYPDQGRRGETLLQKADQALYKAKQTGKNRVCMFSGEMGS